MDYRIFILLSILSLWSCAKSSDIILIPNTITSISPTNGQPGTSVVINGTNFIPTLDGNKVTFNGTSSTVTVANETQLTVTAPTGATGGNLTVIVNGHSASGPKFTYYTVYAFGTRNVTKQTATYWKDGAPTVLPSTIADSFGSGITDMAIAGSNIHAIGYQYGNGSNVNSFPIYWKNGIAIPIGGTDENVTFNAIAVSGPDVYICGVQTLSANTSLGKYWKNGIETKLTSGSLRAKANDIVVLGSDVYVIGSEHPDARYWKNGTIVALTNSEGFYEATQMAISGTDIYVSGYSYPGACNGQALYWKNGIINFLTDGSRQAYANGIVVDGANVYIAGSEETSSCIGKQTAKYWTNGVATTLSNSGSNESAVAVSVLDGDVFTITWGGKNTPGCVFKNSTALPPFVLTDNTTWISGGFVVSY